MLPWYHGTLVPWHHGSMVPWHHGAKAPWYHGTKVKWLHGPKVPCSCGTMVSWYGTMVIAMACRCLDVWGMACQCLGRGVPMSWAWRADVGASWGCQVLPAGSNLVRGNSSWYQLVPSCCQLVPNWYQLVPSCCLLVPAGTSWF